MRKYDVLYLTEKGEINEVSRKAPATPVFEDCFAALGRGSILQTKNGPVAVEDLLPGDEVLTSSNGYKTLLWHGMMQIIPSAPNSRHEIGTMTRITADSFGMGRPLPDLVLGPAARMRHRHPGVKMLTGADEAFVPVRDFIDSSNVIEITPFTPVSVYQIGFEKHECVQVNGIDVETLHPGAPHMIQLKPEMRPLFISLFPHKNSIADFGALYLPRLRLRDLDLFEVA
jgi:hypothetical protein